MVAITILSRRYGTAEVFCSSGYLNALGVRRALEVEKERLCLVEIL